MMDGRFRSGAWQPLWKIAEAVLDRKEEVGASWNELSVWVWGEPTHDDLNRGASRLKRMLGLAPRKGVYQKAIRTDKAEHLCRALDIDPMDVLL